MNQELVIAILLLMAVVIWVIAKVRNYARLSQKQWEQVDKGKLRKWEDEVD